MIKQALLSKQFQEWEQNTERPKPPYNPDITSEIQKEGKGGKDKQNL